MFGDSIVACICDGDTPFCAYACVPFCAYACVFAYAHVCVCVCLCALSHMTPQIHIPGRKYVELRLQMIEWRQMIDETFVYGLRR
jgi:hypothetical protein